MKKRIILVLMIIGLSIVSYGEEEIWNYAKEITIDAEYEFNSFKLDKDVYKNAQFNLSDIRIVDESDCYIPFYISKDKTEERSYEESIQFDRIGKYRYKKHMFYEFGNHKELLKDSAMADELILGVNSSRDYFQYINVYGSLDSEHWQFIQTDSIYRIDDSEDLKISFDQTKKYAYYRLVVLEQQSDIDITNIEGVVLGKKSVTRNYEEKMDIDVFSQKEKDNITELRIEAVSNMPIRKLELEIDGMYKRTVEVWLEKADETQLHLLNTYIYQSLINEKNVNREIELHPNGSYEAIIIKIHNGSDSPLNVKKIEAVIHNDYLVMETEPQKSYRLIYGNKNTIKPNYDIESFRAEIESEAKGSGVLGEQKEVVFDDNKRKCNDTNGEAEKESFFSQKMLFDGLVILISVVLVFVLIKSMNLKKTK